MRRDELCCLTRKKDKMIIETDNDAMMTIMMEMMMEMMIKTMSTTMMLTVSRAV